MANYSVNYLQDFCFDLQRILNKYGFRLICSDPYEHVCVTPLLKEDFSRDYCFSDGSDICFYVPFPYELNK